MTDKPTTSVPLTRSQMTVARTELRDALTRWAAYRIERPWDSQIPERRIAVINEILDALNLGLKGD